MNKCESCGKQYQQTLTSFLGVEYCPHCHEGILPTKKTILRVTPESRVAYVQAERLFKEGYLLDKASRLGFKDKKDALKKAIEKNKHAGLLLHDPYALNALALLYEQNLVDDINDKTVSWKKALTLYESVALNEELDGSLEMETLEKYEIQLKACIGLLRLCTNAPQRFQNKEMRLTGNLAVTKMDRILREYPNLLSAENKMMVKEAEKTYKSGQDERLVRCVDIDGVTEALLDLIKPQSEGKTFMLVTSMTREAFIQLSNHKRKINRNGNEVSFIDDILNKCYNICLYFGAIKDDGRGKELIPIPGKKCRWIQLDNFSSEEGKKILEQKDIYFTVIGVYMEKMFKLKKKHVSDEQYNTFVEQLDNSGLLDKLSSISMKNEYRFTTDDMVLTRESEHIKIIEKIIDSIPKIH